MFRRLIIILLTVLLSYACSCGPKKQNKKPNPETVSTEQVALEDFNRLGENLQEFLYRNGKTLKKWAFKEWGYRTMSEGVRMTGDVLKEFISLDKVNHYDPFVNKSRSKWVDVLLNSDTEYLFCGILDVSESLDCYIYTEVDKKQPGYCDAFALLVKNGKAIGSIQLACEGYGLFDSIESNRISRNTFVMSSHAVDVIDENGDSPGGYYFIRINDDGTVTRSNAYESDFDKPTWKE